MKKIWKTFHKTLPENVKNFLKMDKYTDPHFLLQETTTRNAQLRAKKFMEID